MDEEVKQQSEESVDNVVNNEPDWKTEAINLRKQNEQYLQAMTKLVQEREKEDKIDTDDWQRRYRQPMSEYTDEKFVDLISGYVNEAIERQVRPIVDVVQKKHREMSEQLGQSKLLTHVPDLEELSRNASFLRYLDEELDAGITRRDVGNLLLKKGDMVGFKKMIDNYRNRRPLQMTEREGVVPNVSRSHPLSERSGRSLSQEEVERAVTDYGKGRISREALDAILNKTMQK